ncbi:MAG: DNA polymerase/3'-5' exonuclease PolX [Verrucomicrobia bacterium]|nr:DNA polymerase/3'-5' exonuclease PolX [Pseudomonadota bacterium]NBS06509.1 DNA polymerase/3'-5' exonuclease PolX [Verrucomicrobiota bacterium]NBS79314.1 DNA polymerase/3'-5' exonuclease PolX [bacterium]NBS49787.1 DNA polymerase/3'-5' exonuclease PolX [Verrucomicrobiota bacterium]NBV96885.1 DNA polymerase/3'-5' exonuclease PolX [Verrucomicrobiota bacterium]
MTKDQAAAALREIGTILELQGENPFKCRAYLSAARTLETAPADLAELVRANRLGELPGIGEALREKITTLVTTGKLPYLDQLRSSIPSGLLALLDLPGLGPKKLRALREKLKIESLQALQKACEDGRLASLDGFGQKTATNLLEAIARRATYSKLHRLGDALPAAKILLEHVKKCPAVQKAEIGGSLRRGKEIVKDLDLIAASSRPKVVMQAFVSAPNVEKVIAHGETKSSVLLAGGIPCDLRVIPPEAWATALAHFTGSKEHNIALRQRAIDRGLHLSEWGLFKGKSKTPMKLREEKDLHKALGLSFIPPELREDSGEIVAAEKNDLPDLLTRDQIRGCLHNHTNASDGQDTLAAMAQTAADLGLEWLGIADHSKSSFQAHGLDEKRLLAQLDEIRSLNSKKPRCTLLAGTECDILKGGKLDFPDSLLSELDYVIASVHAGFSSDEEEMTNRVIRAMENEHVTCLGHPTGRLLLERESYALNIPKILDAAAATGTWIELNANPWRLDLDWRWWHKARDLGILCCINPDAHKTSHLRFLDIGVTLARKGWLRAKDVVNTRTLAQLRKLL